MEFKHEPVLIGEVIDGLNIVSEGRYLDGTLGGAGHSEQIAQRLSDKGLLIGIDRDADAIKASKKRLKKYGCNKIFIQENYVNSKEELAKREIFKIDGALLDLGVSSFQLDNAERGFSYMSDAPLDMRMNQEGELTAEYVVNNYEEDELARIIKSYGEERWAKRIASFICKQRILSRITRTGELVDLIKAAIPKKVRVEGPHPAKRTFQAIRIEVNKELEYLGRAVEDICDILRPGGRIVIISFHSLEDRIIKEVFNKRENPCTCPPRLPTCVCGKKGDILRVNRKPIVADEKEIEENPRSRSAKLRIAEKL